MRRGASQTVGKARVSPSAKVMHRSEELAETFKILGNVNRLRILVYLDGDERSVSEIEAALNIHQPTLSQQIGELREAGLLMGRRVAKSVIYSISEPRGRRALQAVYFAGGEMTPQVQPQAASASISQAAMFASVLTYRGASAPDFHIGLKSLLQEDEQ
jgi:ArsR family transcriptional regulator